MTTRLGAVCILVFLAGITLAGCTGDTPAPKGERVITEAEEAVATAETGSVRGQFITIDLEPVVHEAVELLQGANKTPIMTTMTDLQGRFTFNGVAPGTYGLFFGPACCEQLITDVRVAAGIVTEVTKLLERRVVIEPYAVDNEWTGFIACSVHSRNVCLTDSKHADTHYFDVKPGLRSLVVGMTWVPVGGMSTSDDLWLDVLRAQDPGGGYSYAKALGPSPLRLVIDDTMIPDDTGRTEPGQIKFANITEEGLKLRFFVEGPELAVTYQQAFTIYWREYYNMAAPEGAEVVPDG